MFTLQMTFISCFAVVKHCTSESSAADMHKFERNTKSNWSKKRLRRKRPKTFSKPQTNTKKSAVCC